MKTKEGGWKREKGDGGGEEVKVNLLARMSGRGSCDAVSEAGWAEAGEKELRAAAAIAAAALVLLMDDRTGLHGLIGNDRGHVAVLHPRRARHQRPMR